MKSMPNNPSDNFRVLVVEDDSATLESVLLKLTKESMRPVGVGSVDEAFRVLREGDRFSAVLLDLSLPKTDGFHFLEERMRDSRLREIPVIVFTNFSQPEFVKRAVSLGVKGYLVKANHSLDEIAHELRKCLTGGVCLIEGTAIA